MPHRIIGFLSALLLWGFAAHASHNLAGQITYTKLAGANTFELLLTTYTDPTAAGVDRCTADIEVWGIANGQQVLIDIIRDVPRENGPNGNCSQPSKMGVFIRPTIKRNYYRVSNYTFPGPGVYQLRYYDVARINNVSNISNSGSVAFYVETQMVISPFIGSNNSVVLLNDPLDDACLNRIWSHNPGAFDADGDSLVFRLIPCQQYDPSRDINSPINVPNYRYPSDFGGSFTIDASTGLITWDAATRVGIYNISFVVEEYRNGRLISYVIRDMAIFVKPCINRPPVIEVLKDTCVKPNSTLLFQAKVSDPDLMDSVYFYLNNAGQGANGPFNLANSPAGLDPPVSSFPIRATQIDPITALFTWEINCGHIRSQHYQVDWYAHDNLLRFGNEPTLSDNEVTKIRVIPPSVDSLWAESGSRRIDLRWSPNGCSNAIGYEIYRSSGGAVPVDTVCCIGGGLGGAWELVGKTNAWGDTTFVDDNNGQGLDFRGQYCYRIVSVFLGQVGQGLNSTSIVKSCPSPEVCIQIQRDFPVLLHADVRITDAAAGQMFVSWAKPDTSRISSFFPRPFTYDVQQAVGIQGGAFVSLTPTPKLFDDTTLVVNALNTVAQGYRYQIRLLDATGEQVTASDPGSSVYLTTAPADRAVILNWSEFVPWRNRKYIIHRSDAPSAAFVAIDTLIGNGASSHSYTDRGLTVGQEYCYFIEAIGSYNVTGLPDSMINNSNRACEIPVDLIPPCTPPKDSIAVSSDCEKFQVRFFWPLPDTTCASDLAYYTLYFTRTAGGPLTELTRIAVGQTEFLLDNSGPANIAGCYSLTATDTSGNESLASEGICVDNCPVIIIPPVFVPGNGTGGGGIRPVVFRSVRSLRFVVFDRWGVEVGSSTDINNLWDGTRNGNLCAEGVYYYLLEVVLDDLNFTKVSRTGSITLLR